MLSHKEDEEGSKDTYEEDEEDLMKTGRTRRGGQEEDDEDSQKTSEEDEEDQMKPGRT